MKRVLSGEAPAQLPNLLTEFGLLILADDGDMLEALARKLQAAASLRVAITDQVRVVYNDRTTDLTMTVAQAGLQALDRFDVIWRHRV